MRIENAFGEILREKRLKKGLSQEELALETGLDRTYISLLERGQRIPTIKTLFRISRTLKIKPYLFIKDVDEKTTALFPDKP